MSRENTFELNPLIDRLQQLQKHETLEAVVSDPDFHQLLEHLRTLDAFSHSLSDHIGGGASSRTISLLRRLKSTYAIAASRFFTLTKHLAEELDGLDEPQWSRFADEANSDATYRSTIFELIEKHLGQERKEQLLETLETGDPHAIYPTSTYRTSSGSVSSNEDGSYIEAVMTTSTMTEIHITEGVLEFENPILRDTYKSLGRCICVVDTNVNEYYGEEIKAYFAHHDINLTLLEYRAMEVDKGITMVEELLADFKKVGVSRQEPVLIVGGGVIADTGGLACSLYHRNTPYVMLATSIVSGIDAGPSPRTCCDGFGFKNLFGAYHAPVLTLTDRTFFKTLRTGWIRHGIAEIIKMAVVKDIELFELLEDTGIALVRSQFGTATDDPRLSENGQKILSLAMRSYVEAEYGNLYETHQCRPHAYGHTWSPGYEIPSGMLHGHAVACGMGFGAHLSYKQGWISESDRDRILQLINDFELSLWHPILNNHDLIYEAQVKVTEKRGNNLVAPLPKKSIGACGYLNELSFKQLRTSLQEYKMICETFERSGLGVEAHCTEVGLEDPSLVDQILKEQRSVEEVH